MRGLEGKIIVISGAAKGIGKATAKRFIEEGAGGIAILDFDYDGALKTAEELDPSDSVIQVLKCDVSKPDEAEIAVAAVMDRFGRIDVLINNAGITMDVMFHKMTDEQWHTVLDVNLNGAYYLSRRVFPIMRAQEGGAIVNVSSVTAYGNIGQANYSVSKAGLVGLTKTLAKEGGKKGIRVNAVLPAYIKTDMYNTVPEKVLQEGIKSRVYLHRMGEPEEVASVIAFLASDEASFVTGQEIVISGSFQTGT